MNVPISCGVIGVGYLGQFHAQKYAAIETANLIGICDLNKEAGEKVAQELGCKYYSSHKDLVKDVSAVTIAASTPAHYELAKYCLENGVHIHVEKPMTSTSQEGQELCEIAEKNNLKFQVGHVERFNSALIAAQKKLNIPLFIECHRLAPFKPRSMDVDVVLDLMIHDIDVILSLVKSEPVSVSAIGTPVLTKVTDIANARVEFASGTVANITSSRVSTQTQRKFRVFQKSQYLSIDFNSGELNLLTKTGEFVDDEIPLEAESWNLEKGDPLRAETESFLESIIKDKECVVSGRDGLVALKLAEQIIEDINRRLN